MSEKINLTIDDIAKALDVSKTTVSRAISGKGRISDATRARIHAYITEHNYRPNAAAKALAENKTYNLAFVVPPAFIALDLPYVRKSMSAIAQEAFTKNYNILICLSTDDDPTPLLRTLDHRKADGVILSRTVENDRLADILVQRGVPFATLGTLSLENHGKATVEVDHDQVGGCRAFTLDFLHRGDGPVAILGGNIHYIVNQSRLAGVKEALRIAKVPRESAIIRTELRTKEDCAGVIQELLQMGVRRFLATDDELCLHTLELLQSMGLDAKQDVQLASLIDSDALQQHRISALDFDAAALGRAACRELLHQPPQRCTHASC